MFLGHWIGDGHIRMDKDKVRAITEWEAPVKVNELRSFLGLVNYYRRFLSGTSSRSTYGSLKEGPSWSEECQRAFEDLKQAVTKDPVLRLPDHTKPLKSIVRLQALLSVGYWCKRDTPSHMRVQSLMKDKRKSQ